MQLKENLVIIYQWVESERVRQLYKYETISYGVNINEKYDIYGNDLPSGTVYFGKKEFSLTISIYQMHRCLYIFMEVIGKCLIRI